LVPQYALAFARFLTGFCDRVRGETGERDMYVRAAALGFPSYWVDIRHRIHHSKASQMPELQVLARISEEALEYLRRKTWGFDQKAGHNQPLKGARINKFENALGQYSKARKGELRPTAANASSESPSSLEIAQSLSRSSQYGEGAVQKLAQQLMVKMFPSNKPPNMEGAYLIWDPLIQCLNTNRAHFVDALIETLFSSVTTLDSMFPEDVLSKECAYHWIKHLLGLDSNKRAHGFSNRRVNAVLQDCLLSPGYWTKKLAADIVSRGECHSSGVWPELVSVVTSASGERDEQWGVEAKAVGEQMEDVVVIEDNAATESGAWRKFEGIWVPRPFGVV
jgi:Las1-like